MARQLTTLERVILAALDNDPPATMAELRACTGEKQPELLAAIRGLRWRGMIAMDRLALNRPEPAGHDVQAQKALSGETATDPDALTGCADDQLFAEVPVEAVRAALEPRAAPMSARAGCRCRRPSRQSRSSIPCDRRVPKRRRSGRWSRCRQSSGARR